MTLTDRPSVNNLNSPLARQNIMTSGVSQLAEREEKREVEKWEQGHAVVQYCNNLDSSPSTLESDTV